MTVRFTKMNGAGNDFVLIDNRAQQVTLEPAQAVQGGLQSMMCESPTTYFRLGEIQMYVSAGTGRRNNSVPVVVSCKRR